MSTFKDVKNSLVTILTELVGGGQPIAAVYGWNNNNPDEFPAITVQTNEVSAEERLDSNRNQLTMSFIVRVLIQDDRSESTEDARLDLMEEVGDKLRENVDTISGTVLSLDIQGYSPLYAQQDQKYCFFEIALEVTVIKTIS